MKRLIALLICLVMVFSVSSVFADGEIVDVIVDGEVMEFDVPARIYADRTMVPMRAIFEKLGAEVVWIEGDQLIFAVKDAISITMKIDQGFFTVENLLTDDSRRVELDVFPFIMESRTLVPVRAVAESFDCTVEWDEDNRQVIITSNEVKAAD